MRPCVCFCLYLHGIYHCVVLSMCLLAFVVGCVCVFFFCLNHVHSALCVHLVESVVINFALVDACCFILATLFMYVFISCPHTPTAEQRVFQLIDENEELQISKLIKFSLPIGGFSKVEFRGMSVFFEIFD